MKISEFAELLGVPASTLRYYEKKGFLKTERVNGIREYKESDMEYIRFIKRLKDRGMPLKEIKRYADLRYEGNGTISDRLELLRAYRPLLSERLEQYRVYLEKLDDKIALYEEAIITGELSAR